MEVVQKSFLGSEDAPYNACQREDSNMLSTITTVSCVEVFQEAVMEGKIE
jgi:hypothetical protein